MNDTDVGRVRAFLLGSGPPPHEALLRTARLAAYAYTVLAEDHPLRPALRQDYLAALARHHRIVEELTPLVAAWSAAGVRILFFKGFHLSEFVYPVPGGRFHGDVDVLVRERDEEVAAEVARELGWDVALPLVDRRWTHGVCNLGVPGGATRVDLHRFLVHSRLRVNRAPARVTRAVWEASIERSWRGSVVRTPTTVDALLVLALQRAWGERGGLKPHDLVDVRQLVTGEPEWRRALEDRAAELGARRTVAFFLDRCDPERGRLELWPATSGDGRWRRAVLPERPLVPFEQGLHRATLAPGLLLDIVRILPDLWRGWRAARRTAPLGDILAAVTPRSIPATAPSRHDLVRAVRAVRWAMRLWPRPDRTCLVRSLALYSALRRQGWPVDFVSGVRRADSGVTGHAWIELDGRVLPELREAELVGQFRPNFRHPGPASPAEPDSEPSPARAWSSG